MTRFIVLMSSLYIYKQVLRGYHIGLGLGGLKPIYSSDSCLHIIQLLPFIKFPSKGGKCNFVVFMGLMDPDGWSPGFKSLLSQRSMCHSSITFTHSSYRPMLKGNWKIEMMKLAVSSSYSTLVNVISTICHFVPHPIFDWSTSNEANDLISCYKIPNWITLKVHSAVPKLMSK